MSTPWRLPLVALASAPSIASAHDGRPLEPHDLWLAWDLDPAIVAPLATVALLYVVGVRRTWRRSDRGRRGLRRTAACFGAGWLALTLALVSPLHALGGALFSAHMTQHELLMVVAAPLMMVGRPLAAYAWGLPRGWRHRLSGWTREPWLRSAWQIVTTPAVASLVHAVLVGVWHLPAPYQATLTNDAWHGLQHVCFFGSALLFWWAMLRPRHIARGQSVLCLFATTLWTGALGALMAFAPNLWYPGYAATTGPWGLTPLEDQQLGGIIMWIPGGGSYLIAALALLALWLRESERRARHQPALTAPTWRSA